MEGEVGIDEVVADWIAIRILTKIHETAQQGLSRIHQKGIPQQKCAPISCWSQM